MTQDSRARILIVDDRPENLLALEVILEPLGHELIRAESGPEALRALLRDALEAEGFTVNRNEWWHFDYRDWRRYRIGTTRFEQLTR